jgi:hypothetical protein
MAKSSQVAHYLQRAENLGFAKPLAILIIGAG